MALSDGYPGSDALASLSAAKNYNQALADLIANEVGDGPILDFGAGTGTFAKILRHRGFDVHCVEPDGSFRKRLLSDGFVASSSLEKLKAPGGSIYSLNVLEHVEDDRGALLSLAEYMGFGSALVLFVPAYPMLFSSFDQRIGHYRRYTRRGLIQLVEDAGLEVSRCVFFDSLGFLAAVVYKLLDTGDGHLSRWSVKAFDSVVFPISRLIDRLANRVVGKNLLLVARKPDARLRPD